MLLDHSSNKLVSMRAKIDRPLERWLWRCDITQLPRDKGSFYSGYNSVHIDYKHMPNGRHAGGQMLQTLEKILVLNKQEYR